MSTKKIANYFMQGHHSPTYKQCQIESLHRTKVNYYFEALRTTINNQLTFSHKMIESNKLHYMLTRIPCPSQTTIFYPKKELECIIQYIKKSQHIRKISREASKYIKLTLGLELVFVVISSLQLAEYRTPSFL